MTTIFYSIYEKKFVTSFSKSWMLIAKLTQAAINETHTTVLSARIDVALAFLLFCRSNIYCKKKLDEKVSLQLRHECLSGVTARTCAYDTLYILMSSFEYYHTCTFSLAFTIRIFISVSSSLTFWFFQRDWKGIRAFGISTIQRVALAIIIVIPFDMHFCHSLDGWEKKFLFRETSSRPRLSSIFQSMYIRNELNTLSHWGCSMVTHVHEITRSINIVRWIIWSNVPFLGDTYYFFIMRARHVYTMHVLGVQISEKNGTIICGLSEHLPLTNLL